MAGPKDKLQRVVTYLPLELELEIEQLARRESRPVSNQVACLLVEALEQRDRKTKRGAALERRPPDAATLEPPDAATLERRATKGETG